MHLIELKAKNKRGDLNGDGEINSTDCAFLKRHILQINGFILTDDKLTVADLNNDGNVDSLDLALINRYVLGIITEFPNF